MKDYFVHHIIFSLAVSLLTHCIQHSFHSAFTSKPSGMIYGSPSNTKSNFCIASVASCCACKHHAGNVMQVRGSGEKKKSLYNSLKIKLFLYTHTSFYIYIYKIIPVYIFNISLLPNFCSLRWWKEKLHKV